MTQEHPLPLRQRMQRLLNDAEQIVDAWRLAGRWDAALTLLRGTQPIAQEQGDTAMAMHALVIGRVLIDQAGFGGFDTYTEREATLDDALTHAIPASDPALLGAIWDAKGLSLHTAFLETDHSTEPADELAYFERGLALRQQAADQRGIAESLFHVGLVYGVIRRDHQRALTYFRDSYELAQAVGDVVMASYAIRHIAFAQHADNDLPAARASLEESLRLREAAGFVPGVAMAWLILAYADADLGQRAAALEHLRRAKDIFVALGAERRVAWMDELLEEFRHPPTTS